MNRRDFLRMGGKFAIGALALKLGFSPEEAKSAEAIQSAMRPEDLDRSILDLETKLAPGGSFALRLNDPETSAEEVDWIFRYVNRVLDHVEIRAVMPEQYVDQKEAQKRAVPPKEQFHGTSEVRFTKIVNEKAERHICHGYYVSFGGASYYATANHCIAGTTEANNFVPLGTEKRDIAVRYEPYYQGGAVVLDEFLTDADIQGRMMAIQGERLGKPFTRSSFLIKMNEDLYRKVFDKPSEKDGWLGAQFASTFMCLLQPGDSSLDWTGHAPPQGMSGSMVAVWRDGYRAAGTFYGIRVLNRPGPQTGLNSPMGFVVGINALKDACARARAQHENDIGRPAEETAGWITRIQEP